MRRKAVKDYFARLFEEKCGDQRKFWTTIRPFSNSRKQTELRRIILKHNGKIIKDQSEMAKTFKSFFTGDCGNVNVQRSNAAVTAHNSSQSNRTDNSL